MTPDQLFEFADKYARQAEADGRGTRYPTFREVARHFRVTHAAIEQACEDWDSAKGYLKPAVGIKVGNSIGEFARKGEYLVEAYV
jgi:hypothetical protein